MFRKMANYLCLFFVFSCLCFHDSIQLVPLPDFIHPCAELTDECFTKATLDAIPGMVKGIPEANIPPLEPLYLDRNVSLELPGNVKITFHNGKLSGLSTCKPTKVSSQREKRTFIFDIICDFVIRGLYSIKGHILIFNLDTDGNAKIKIRNQKIHLDVLEKVVKDKNGEKHYKVNSYKYTTDFGSDLTMNFTNIIRGNQQITDNINQLLNANAHQVVGEFGGPIMDYAMDYAMEMTQRFFSTYTFDQLSLVPVPDNFFENN